MNLETELADLQDALANTDLSDALRRMNDDQGLIYLLVKILQPIRIKIDGNRNHKRPHIHIDYGRKFHAATYATDTGERLVGDRKYDYEVFEWIGKNRPKPIDRKSTRLNSSHT